MKFLQLAIMACALAIPAFAQDATTNAPVASLVASNAVVTAPLVLTNDCIYLAGEQAELTNGGRAVFSFNLANAGDYVIEAMVNAPDESSNSFFANIDAEPQDPDMIWDMDVTTGFEKRVISWRGNGDASTDQFTPKHFKLEAGKHTLNILGREPGTELKSLSIIPAPPEKPVSP